MLFNSHIFLLVFLPITLVGYFALGRLSDKTPAKIWLIAGSLFFYGWYNPVFLILIVGSILGNYIAADRILAAAKSGNDPRARLFMILGVIGNLALLGYFKYANFFIDTASAMMGRELLSVAIFLPLAISFFTFQQIAYLVDAREHAVEDHNLVDFALFVSFFPQLIAGPIVHHGQVMPQFRSGAFHPRADNMAQGIAFVVLGLLKKVLVADTLIAIAAPVFDNATTTPPGMLDAWLGLTAFTLGIYFDFSGYSDIAVGLARMFGIKLPYNFNSPYKAVSIIDFWRRWHLTLSRFLRDYVYIPLGGNRKGKSRRYVNLMATMLLGGLWHGAGWTFVVWGGLHGLYLVINHGWEGMQKRMTAAGKTPIAMGTIPAMVLTLLAVMLAWVFFFADSFAHATAMLAGLSGMNGFASPDTMAALANGPLGQLVSGGNLVSAAIAIVKDGRELIIMGIAAILVIIAPNTQELIDRDNWKPRNWLQNLIAWRPNMVWAGGMAVVGCVLLTQMTKVQEFIYFQF